MNSQKNYWRRKVAGGCAAALLVASMASACGSNDSESTGDGPTTVRFFSASNLKDVSYAPLTSTPTEMGYWKKEGVDVKFSQITGGAAALQALATGQADMVFAGTSTWFPFLSTGAAVIAVCNTGTKFINTPMVPQDSPIRSIRDLAGKKIAVTSPEASQIPIITAMLQSVGLKKSDVTFVSIDPGPAAIAAYEKGSVHAFGYFDSPHAQMDALLKQRGSGLRPLEIPDRFKNLAFEAGVFVTPTYLKENRKAVVGVLRGIAQGYTFAAANPQAAVKIHWKLNPESKPAGGDEAQNLATAESMVKTKLTNAEPIDGKYCSLRPEDVTAEMQVLHDAGILKEQVDASKSLDLSLVNEVNAFDKNAVAEQARAWKQ